jgi:protein RecA
MVEETIMESERRKKLIESLKSFNKSQKENVLDFANQTQDLEIIPTGIKSFDKFLGGGTKRGTYTILWGGYSVGKTSLVLQQIANAQKEGKVCCYINLEKPIDQSRFLHFGVNLDDLVLANHTKNAEQALTIIRTLCKDKVVDLIVIDSLNAMAPKAELESKGGVERDLEEKNIAELARAMSEFCRKVNPDIYRAKTSVVIIGQTRIGGIGSFYTRATLSGGEAIKFYSYNIVFMRRGQKNDAPVQKIKEYFLDPDGKVRFATQKEEIGFDVCFRMDKTNSSASAREHQEVHLPFVYDKGFVDEVIESEEIPIRIDAKTDEEREKIDNYLKEKNIIKEKEKSDDIVIETSTTEELEVIKEPSVEEPIKKTRGRGRPPKKEKK